MTAPRMPVAMTRTAVSGGAPPSASVTAIATPAVIDFGASAIRTGRGAPSPLATSTAEAIATVAPTSSAAASGQTLRLTSAKLV
jgi:hypothetical protein